MSPIVADLIMNVMTFEKISVVFFIFSMAFVLMLLENQYPSAKLTHWIVHKTKVRTLCLGISIRCSILSHRWITSEETCLSKQNVVCSVVSLESLRWTFNDTIRHFCIKREVNIEAI
ncbi:hypothetical protein T4B_9195 [Trichinella pseudospiralis]|uniref:Uncharacterized protein n=1 Tax=Trichinella pseudospiralis TaxID=6337 RepID=A0A0V1IFC0_TRIPS|nr:hypothetical protein T4B_9195 [Trichinella pseudospiralis]KRZ28286.1 hypothetical protein T4C_6041 [Trichinella pseudospiralis]